MQHILDTLFSSMHQVIKYEKKYSSIYKIHKYWARKPWYVIEKYISQYTKPGELVLDPFCGSGSTGVEATVSGRNFLGYDLNPIAIWITEQTLQHDIDINRIQSDYAQIEKVCRKKILDLYATEEKCPICGDIITFKHINIGPKFNNEYIGATYCSSCKSRKANQRRLLTSSEKAKYLNLLELDVPYWYPDTPFPEKFYKDRFSYKGILKVSDMFTKKNLFALALLLKTIKELQSPYEKLIILAFTNTILHASKLKAENVRPLSVNNYWIPDDYIEENVWFRFEDRFNHIILGKQALKKRIKENGTTGSYEIKMKSALQLDQDNSVDYIFTDPPYGEAIQYSELSFIWNAWISDTYNIQEEIIINPVQKKSAQAFNILLHKALQRIYIALKNERYFTLCFNNKDFKIWKNVIDSCKEIGFVLDNIQIYDLYGNPYNQTWSKFSPKTDIYVTFKKNPVDDSSERFFNKDITLEEIIREVILYTKKHDHVVDAVKIYDVTISYIIWNLFYNKGKILIDSFDMKKFSELFELIIEKEKGN